MILPVPPLKKKIKEVRKMKFEFLDYLPAPQREQARKELELLQKAGIPEEEIFQTIWRKYKPSPQQTNVAALSKMYVTKMYVTLEGYILYTTAYDWGIIARFADSTGGINLIIHKDSRVELPEDLPAKVRVIGRAKPNKKGKIVVFPTSIQLIP
ncbi:MAG: hypothetical protein QXP46_07270 [Archaeoglobaceae archaeon]